MATRTAFAPTCSPRYSFQHWINSKQYIAAIVNRLRVELLSEATSFIKLNNGFPLLAGWAISPLRAFPFLPSSAQNHSLTRFFRLSPSLFLVSPYIRAQREIFQARTRRGKRFIPTRSSAATAHHHRVEDNQNWRGGDLRTREERGGVSFHEILTQFPEAWPSVRRYRCLIVARTNLRPGMNET